MRRISVALTLSIAVLHAAASSQSYIVNDLIAQTMANMSAGWPEGCVSLEWPEKPKAVARFDADAKPALLAYIALAARGVDPSPAYKRNWPERWMLDGIATKDLASARDPWAARVARLEPVVVLLGRGEVFGHGHWRAYSAEGALLGTYDAEMIRKTKGYAIGRLRLWSPGQEGRATPVVPYCAMPGDHERYLRAKAAIDAEKAAKRARKQGAAR